MTPADAMIARLDEAARAAEAREEAFRKEVAETTARLESERTTAYRRLNFLRALVARVTAAETPEAAVAAAQAHVRERFDWQSESEARTQVLEHLTPLALALFGAAHPAEDGASPVEADPAAEMAAFEAWYEQTRASSFWQLFDYYMPETPRVDY